VQGAVEGAQQAVDGAQALVEAPQQIALACDTALAALAPGSSVVDAEAAMREATAQLDQAIGDAAAIPGVTAVRDAFVGALESLGSQTDTAASQSARETVTTACGLFSGGSTPESG
jgi:hypothetical protein